MQPGKYIHSCVKNFMTEFRLEQIFIAQAQNPSWWGNKTSSNTTTDQGQSSGPAVMLWGSWDQRWAQQAADSQDSNTSQPVLGSSARLYKALPDPLSHVPCPVLVPHIQLFQLLSLLLWNHSPGCPAHPGWAWMVSTDWNQIHCWASSLGTLFTWQWLNNLYQIEG